MLLDLGEQKVKTKPCRRALGTATIEFMLKSFDYYNYSILLKIQLVLTVSYEIFL